MEIYLKPLLFFLMGLLVVILFSYFAPIDEGKKPRKKEDKNERTVEERDEERKDEEAPSE